jgi:CubicO group peptidase (beta-lactamase class C family)
MSALLPTRRHVLLGGLLCAGSSLGTLVGVPAQARGTPHPAETPATALNASFREWMSQYQIPAASIAMMHDGRLVSTFGFGGMNAATPARIASLSKAITAVSIGHLIDAGRLSFTTPIGTVLAPAFRRLGQPVDPRFKAITIEQLLKHRAGLAREPRPGPRERTLNERFIATLATPLTNDPGGEMVYSNIGYITLGVIIETVTAADYERYCREVALRPMRASGTIDPKLRQRAASGGWLMSAADYARFIQVFEPGSPALGPIARQWQESLPGSRAYGLGVYIAKTSRGAVLTHSGRSVAPERGGSYLIKYPNGWTAVTTFAGDPRNYAADLRRRLQTGIASL